MWEEGEDPPLPPDDCRSLSFFFFFYWHMWPSALGAGQSWSCIWGTKVSFHTWTATGRKKKKKSKFNYRDSIGKHVQTHKSKLIGTHLVDTNTCTYSDVHKHVHTQTLSLTLTHTHTDERH